MIGGETARSCIEFVVRNIVVIGTVDIFRRVGDQDERFAGVDA